MPKSFRYSVLLISFISIFSSRVSIITAQNCAVENKAFSSGEEIVYEIWYNWGFLWMESGIVTFNAKTDTYNGAPCYHLCGVGATFPKYDWFFSVRDSFYSWVDTSSLHPFKFVRTESEGSRYIHEECYFNYSKQKSYSVMRDKKKMPRMDSTKISPCSFDVLTLIYYSRNIDFSNCKLNDTIPFEMYLENKVYPTYVRYLGREVFDVEGVGKFNCVKFRAKLLEGTLFSGGESMTVWVTDDKNRIPVYVEAPILVGAVKAKIYSWKGLRNKMTAKVE